MKLTNNTAAILLQSCYNSTKTYLQIRKDYRVNEWKKQRIGTRSLYPSKDYRVNEWKKRRTGTRSLYPSKDYRVNEWKKQRTDTRSLYPSWILSSVVRKTRIKSI